MRTSRGAFHPLAHFLALVSIVAGVPCSGQGVPFSPVTSGVDVRIFGAAGDGKHNDTRAIQAAIDSCHRAGGGTVFVPAGTYRTGTLILRDHITLDLRPGATLAGSSELGDYIPKKWRPAEEQRLSGAKAPDDFGSLHLLYAESASRIAIVGGGTIDGNGRRFWTDNYEPLPRPHQMVQFENCSDVRLEGVSLVHSPFWAVNFLGCRRVRVSGVTILNDRQGPNTDGIDISSSADVVISDCFIDTGDDAICLKAPFVDRPVENITITNCILISDDSALKLGTRSNGDIRYVVVSNCVIRNSGYGISLFMKDGGTFEHLLFDNMVVETVDAELRRRSTFPLFIDLERRTPESSAGIIREVTFRGLRITSGGHSLFGGLPGHRISGITLEDINVRIPRAFDILSARKPRGVQGLATPEEDHASIPSCFTFTNVQGLTMRDITIDPGEIPAGRDRHAVFAVESDDLTVENLRVTQSPGKLPIIALERCPTATLRHNRMPEGSGVFLRLAGATTKEITLIDNELRPSTVPVERSPEVSAGAVRQSIR